MGLQERPTGEPEAPNPVDAGVSQRPRSESFIGAGLHSVRSGASGLDEGRTLCMEQRRPGDWTSVPARHFLTSPFHKPLKKVECLMSGLH